MLIKECNVNDLNWISILIQHVLPSLSISYGNPYLSNLLWSKLESLPYTTRFEIYRRWKDIDHPHVFKAVSLAKSDLRRLLRRLSKENIKQYGRLLGKLVHSNPTIIFPLLLEQCQAYDNLIPPIIESCRYLTPLAYDILAFSILQQLMKQQDHMKDDATFIASWLQRLASFIGQLAKRYAMDLLPIIDYLNARMVDGRAVEVCILEELLSKLGGIESRWEISDAQVEVLIAGPVLKGEVIPRNRKLVTKLNPLVSLDTWLLLAYQRTISEDLDEDVLKLASTLFDQATAGFLQYSEYVEACPEIGLSDPREHDIWPSLSLDSQMTIWRTWRRRRQEFSFASLSTWRDIFWTLDLGDVHVPIGRYQSEIARIKTLLITAESRKDKERGPGVISALEGELKGRIQHAQSITTQLTALVIDVPIAAFIQEAIYPRCIMSVVDATFCAKFITFAHPHVNVFAVLNELTDMLPTILIACTEREAKYFGKLYSELMIVADSWHRDADKFIAEAHIGKGGNGEGLVDYEEFRHLLFALHNKIVVASGECIEPEGEFLRLRSAIIFLSVLAGANVFPRIDSHARTLLRAVKELKKRDAREDIKVMSVRVEASLKAAKTMREAEFHFVMDTSSREEIGEEEAKVEEDLVEELVSQQVQMMDLEEGERTVEPERSPIMSSASSAAIETVSKHDSQTQQSKDSLSQKVIPSEPSSPRESKKRSREPTPTRLEREAKRREALPLPQSQRRELSPRESAERSSRSGNRAMDVRPIITRQSSLGRPGGADGGLRGRGRSGNELPPTTSQQYSPRTGNIHNDYPRDQHYHPQSAPSLPPDHQLQQQPRYEPSPRDLSRDWRDLRASESHRDRHDSERRQREARGGRYRQ